MDRDLNVGYNLLNVRKEFVRLAHPKVTPVEAGNKQQCMACATLCYQHCLSFMEQKL